MKTALSYVWFSRIVNVFIIVSFIITPIYPVFAEEIKIDTSTLTEEASASDQPKDESPTSDKVDPKDEISIDLPEEAVIPELPKEEKPIDEQEEKPEEDLVEDDTRALSGNDPTTLNTDLSKVILGEVDEHSGAFNYSYQFPLPPYRGMNPELSLSYNSQNKSKTSITGYGFELSIPYIRRLNRDGVSKMYNEYNFYSSFSGELQSLYNGNEQFGSKTSNGDFLEYTRNQNNTWTMKTKDGFIYVFGNTSDSRQSDPNNSNNVYTWYLTSITDSNGNEILYTYTKETNQIYPTLINYGPYQVELTYQNGSDNKTSQYFSNFEVKSEKKLSEVEISFDGNLQKVFNISYLLSSQNRISLINEIIDNSDSSNPQITELNYENGDYNFVRDPDWDMPYYLNSNIPTGYALGNNSIFIDINNDGLLDFVTTANTTFSNDGDSPYNDADDTVFINNGSGYERDPDWDMPYAGSNGISYGVNSSFVDLNNDGYIDFITTMTGDFVNDGDSPYNDYYRTVFINDGYNFIRDPNWSMPYYGTKTSIPIGTSTTLEDVNNDGLIDFISTNSNTNRHAVFLNTGTGFVKNSNWAMPYRSIYPIVLSTNSTYIDLNGDGLVDFFYTGNEDSFTGGTSHNDEYKTVYINNGIDGFYRDSSWEMPYNPLLNKGLALGPNSTFADINNDGLPDFIYAIAGVFQPTCGGGPHNDCTKTVFINKGKGFYRDTNWEMPYSNSSGAGFGVAPFATFSDVNNDGLADYVYTNTGNNNIFVNDGDSDYNDPDKTVFINTGTDFVRDPNWDMPYYLNGSTPTAFNLNVYSNFTDINNDGFTDFIITCNTPTCTNLVFGNDGDSLYNDSDQTVFLSTGVRDILLSSVTSPKGGILSVKYNEKEIDNYFPSKSRSPSSVTVATSISYDDLINPISTTTYTYDVAKYYFDVNRYKRFTGFTYSQKIDPYGNITRTYYHQGDGPNASHGEFDDHWTKIGKPYRIEKLDSNYNMYELIINKWINRVTPKGFEFVRLSRQINLTYDGNGTHLDTAYEYDYNSENGNLIQKTSFGKVIANSSDGSFTDTDDDLITEYITYAKNINLANDFCDYIIENIVRDFYGNKINATIMYYDNLQKGEVTNGNLTKIEKLVKTDSGNNEVYVNTQNSYNIYGLPVSSTDERGKVTSYIYDTYNLYPITIINPLNQTTQYTFDYSSGEVTQLIDENSFIYQNVYDNLDRLIEEKIPSLVAPYTPVTKTTYTYDDTPGEFRIKKTDYLDDTNIVDVYHYYDGFGREIQIRSEAESVGTWNTSDVVYDKRGLVEKKSLPYTSTGTSRTPKTTISSLYITNTYDPIGRLKTMTDVTGTTTYNYDDWVTTTTDKNNKVKKYYKDAYNNLIKVDEVNGSVTYTTNYKWDISGNLIKITDSLGNIRNFNYDGLGRRTKAEDLHAPTDTTFGIWTYTYDNASNLSQTVNPNGTTTTYTYNDINQLLTENYSGSSISYSYSSCINGISKLCGISMSPGVNENYTYDARGNIISESKNVNGTNYSNIYSYDRNGNILTIKYPDNAEVKYTYNQAGLLEKIEWKESSGTYNNIVSDFNYNPLNQKGTIIYGNGVTTTNTYNPNSLYRLTRRLTENNSGTKLQDINFSYDNIGNITNITDNSNTSSIKTINYTYDDLYRLLGTSGTYNYSYSYNPIGNITSSPSGSYTYQGNTGTSYANPHATTKLNGTTFSYDKNGNLLSNGTLINSWNTKNRLIESKIGSYSSKYSYSASGERATFNLYKRVLSGVYKLVSTTIYPSDYYNTYSEPNVVLSPKKTKQIYGDGELVATIETTLAYDQYHNIISVITPYWNHVDHLGGVNSVSNISGNLVQSLDYYPYGGSRVSSGSYNSQRKYIGEVYDSISELNYLNARYYNSKQGQFISQDSMFWNFDQTWLLDPQNQNSYSYARNNPINLSDPSGNCPQCIAFAGAVVVGGLIGGTISAVNGGSFWDGAKYGAIAGGTTAIVVMTAGMAAPALGITSAQAIIGGSAVGNALGGTLARTAAGENTTIADVGIDTVTGAAGGMLGVGYLKYKGNMGANGNYIPSMSTKDLPQDAQTLLNEYKANGWQKATSGTTGEPHVWKNAFPKGALPGEGTIYDAQYTDLNTNLRGYNRFVKTDNNIYFSDTHYGKTGPVPFYKLTK